MYYRIRNWQMPWWNRISDLPAVHCSQLWTHYRWPPASGPALTVDDRRWQFTVCYVCIMHILKVWHRINNPIPSIDALLEEQSFSYILSWTDLKWWSLRFFKQRCPNNMKNKKKSSDMASVPDPKMIYCQSIICQGFSTWQLLTIWLDIQHGWYLWTTTNSKSSH